MRSPALKLQSIILLGVLLFLNWRQFGISSIGLSILKLPFTVHYWYVTTSGNDDYGCDSPATPCKSIMGALSKPGFTPGDLIYVAQGVYHRDANEVVLIDQDVKISGGWDERFTNQGVYSYLEGQCGVKIMPNVTVEITNFGLYGNYAEGVFNQGELTLKQVSISSTNSRGLYNSGAVDISGGYFSHNWLCAISNDGVISGRDVELIHNYQCGIANNGTLSFSRLTIRDQQVTQGCSAIVNYSTLTLTDSAIVENGNTYPNQGAGLCNYGEATLVNTTIAKNDAGADAGGGIFDNGAELSLNNVTVSFNHANDGGGIYSAGNNVKLRNSLVSSNNSDNGNHSCTGLLSSEGYNLMDHIQGCNFQSSTGDLLNVNGQVQVIIGDNPPVSPLIRSSPAIDAGNPDGCRDDQGNLLPFDQRGVLRLGRCDIGAYEYDPNFDPLIYINFPIMAK
jgi:hypothetical protein